MKLALLVLLAAAACSDDDPAPQVDVQSATPDRLNTMDDAANDLMITVHYSDRDGDLGGGTAEVHDCRADALVTTLALPTIAPPGAVADKDSISGTLVLDVDDVGAFDAAAMPPTCSDLGVSPLAANTTVFCVILVDEAGHRSAGSCTPTITLF